MRLAMPDRRSLLRFIVDWLPVCLLAGLIFALSDQPDLSTHLGVWDTVLRKCAHAASYALLAILLARALRSRPDALALALLYAATDELHQHFVHGRHGTPVDVGIDAVGMLLGLAATIQVRRLRLAVRAT
jgi:VanZ family protein